MRMSRNEMTVTKILPMCRFADYQIPWKKNNSVFVMKCNSYSPGITGSSSTAGNWLGGGASGLLTTGRGGLSIFSIKYLSLKGLRSRPTRKSELKKDPCRVLQKNKNMNVLQINCKGPLTLRPAVAGLSPPSRFMLRLFQSEGPNYSFTHKLGPTNVIITLLMGLSIYILHVSLGLHHYTQHTYSG